MENKRIREYDLARAIAIVFMIAVHTKFSIYNYENALFGNIITNLGSPFCAPIFMFILGSNVYLSRHNSPKELFHRGLKIFGLSYIFNIICHSLPFFILDCLNHTVNYAENTLHWVFAVDILTFAGLAMMFFALVRYLKINNKLLVLIGAVLCVINFVLVKNCQIDFNSHPLLAGITSLFYNSSLPGYFSFFGWIIMPIAGYIFIQIREKIKDLDRFYLYLGSITLIAYIILAILPYHFNTGSYLVYPGPDEAYYHMHPYQAVGYVIFCLAWLSILHFVSKIIPSFLDKTITRLNNNLTTIYLIQWFVINYFLVLPSNYTFFAGVKTYLLCVIGVILISDFGAYYYKKNIKGKLIK